MWSQQEHTLLQVKQQRIVQPKASMSQLSTALQPVRRRGAHGPTQPLLVKGVARWPDHISLTLEFYQCLLVVPGRP